VRSSPPRPTSSRIGTVAAGLRARRLIWHRLGVRTGGGHVGPPLLIVLLGFSQLLSAAPSPVRTLPALGLSVESAALLMSGQEGGELPVGVYAIAAPGEDGKTRILFRLRLGGPALLAGQTSGVLRVEISLYMLDPEGGVQTSELETVEVDLASQREAIERSGLDFLGSFELRPGSYSLRMLARNPETRKLGVRSAALQVPNPATLQPQALPPAPAVDPRPTARSSGLGPFDPPFFPDDVERPARQADLGPEGEAPPPPVPSLSETAEGRKIQKAARTDYRNALGMLIAGREAEALAAVAAFEDALLQREEKSVRFEQLAEIEVGVARDLAAAEPESLAPLLELHLRLFQEGAAKRRYPGATLTQEMVLRLAALDRERQPQRARQFERALGVELLRAGLRSHGDEVLQTVLAAAPGDEIARLELAVHAERRGEHGEAIRHLEALLHDHPDNREARLRLALDQAQVGRTRTAEEGLRRLIHDDTDKWGLHLAYQELARLRMGSDPGAADDVLRAGLRRLPGDEKLTLLQAAARERRGMSAAAREVLDGLKPEGNDGGGSARHHYNQVPEEPYATALADLRREAAARLPSLQAALEETAK
jgi:tetratricopeptide repeat protein